MLGQKRRVVAINHRLQIPSTIKGRSAKPLRPWLNANTTDSPAPISHHKELCISPLERSSGPRYINSSITGANTKLVVRFHLSIRTRSIKPWNFSCTQDSASSNCSKNGKEKKMKRLTSNEDGQRAGHSAVPLTMTVK